MSQNSTSCPERAYRSEKQSWDPQRRSETKTESFTQNIQTLEKTTSLDRY